jgi:hypothetical protein
MFKSIFADHADNESEPQAPLAHLQYNIQSRGKVLENIQNKVYYEQNFLQDKNGTYLSMLMNEYKSKVKKMRLEQMQDEIKGKSTHFESIFANDPFREELKENKVQEVQREEYFKKYVMKPKQQEDLRKMLQTYTNTVPKEEGKGSVVFISNPRISKPQMEEDKLKEYELLRMNQLKKQYNMYQTMLSDLFQENEELIEKTQDKFVCKNKKILNALEPVVLGSIKCFADDIAELFLDDLLEEAVMYMNRIEEYQLASQDIMTIREENNQEFVIENRKRPLPYNLIQALKVLDEYADD